MSGLSSRLTGKGRTNVHSERSGVSERSLPNVPRALTPPAQESRAQSCQGVRTHAKGLLAQGEGVQPKSVQRRVCSLALRFSVRLFPFPSSIRVSLAFWKEPSYGTMHSQSLYSGRIPGSESRITSYSILSKSLSLHTCRMGQRLPHDAAGSLR